MAAPDALHRTDADARALAMARAVQCVVSPGGVRQRQGHDPFSHLLTERRDARRSGLVAQQAVDAPPHEALLPAPDCGFDCAGLPRMIAAVPQPSAVSSTIRARQTCFCGLFRSATTASRRARSAALTSMMIPVRMPQTRTSGVPPESQIGLFRQVLSTKIEASALGASDRNLSLRSLQTARNWPSP